MIAKSGFYVYISIIIMVIPTVEWVHACGPITHIEIAHRAREIVDTSHEDYRKLLYLHGDAYEAGSVYPDTYYYPTCYSGHYHSISEDTHWVPFINATVNYIRRTYGDPPWNVSGQKLVAFLFGVTSHQIADVLWHSFDIKQGFLQTLAKMDFHDDFDIAHSFGDIADDAVNMYSLDTEYIPYTSWYVPVNDLYLIYRDMYGEDKISTAVIQDCTAMMLMMRLGEKIAFPQLYHHYAKRSPFIVDELEHYFQGGITDMSMWSVRKYKQVIEMMEQSTRSCNLTRNIIFVHCNNESSLPSDGEPRPTRSAAPDLSTGALKFTLSDVNVTDAYNGISVTVNQNGMEYLENMNKGQPAESRSRKHNSMYQEYVDRDKREPQRQPHQTYTTKYMYSKLGWCTLSRDLNGDGDEDLILSAPGYSSDSLAQIGRVYIIYGPDFPVSAQSDPLYIEDVADFILEGVHEGSQFGYAVTFVDLNGDNITDIAISAPRDGSELLQYTGAVYVFYGSTGGYLHHPDITILCKVQYCNLGETLSYGDIDNSGSTDLIIGAPTASHNGTQAGLVGVVLAKKQTASVMFIEDAEYILYGRQNYSWFGAAVEHYTVGISNMLIIGAPNYRICNSTCTSYNNSDTQTVGAVYIYRDLYIKYNTVNTTLYGSVEFERFGAALAVGINQELDFYTLSIASPSKLSKLEVYRFDTMTMYQAGAVYLYNISTINVTLYASLHGDRPIAKYGQHVLFTDINYDGNDDLLISVPLRNPDLTQHVVTENHGKVYVYLHNTLTTGDITSKCGVRAVRPCPGHMNALEFATAERNGQFGSSFTVVKQNRTQTFIAVSSVMSNLAGRLTGMIQLYLLH